VLTVNRQPVITMKHCIDVGTAVFAAALRSPPRRLRGDNYYGFKY